MKNSEKIIADYLQLLKQYRNINHDLYNEREHNGKKVDFSLWDEDEYPIVFWEVADYSTSKKEINDYCRKIESGLKGQYKLSTGETSGMKYIKKKIRQKSKQLHSCSPYPTMLILPEWSGILHLSNDDVTVAMYGWPTIQISLNTESPIIGTRDNSGKFVDEAIAKDNNYISAVALVRKRNIAHELSGLTEYSKKLYETFGPGEFRESLYNKKYEEMTKSGYDFESETTYLEIYLNRYAYKKWPDNLIGEYDQVFEYQDKLRMTKVKDGLESREEHHPPSSQVNDEFQYLLNDPKLRNE